MPDTNYTEIWFCESCFALGLIKVKPDEDAWTINQRAIEAHRWRRPICDGDRRAICLLPHLPPVLDDLQCQLIHSVIGWRPQPPYPDSYFFWKYALIFAKYPDASIDPFTGVITRGASKKIELLTRILTLKHSGWQRGCHA